MPIVNWTSTGMARGDSTVQRFLDKELETGRNLSRMLRLRHRLCFKGGRIGKPGFGSENIQFLPAHARPTQKALAARSVKMLGQDGSSWV